MPYIHADDWIELMRFVRRVVRIFGLFEQLSREVDIAKALLTINKAFLYKWEEEVWQ